MSAGGSFWPACGLAALARARHLPKDVVIRRRVDRSSRGFSFSVPTLFRFVAFLALLGGLVFGCMVALVTFVQPVPREMVETVPPSKLLPK
jgi:hypothetical protein